MLGCQPDKHGSKVRQYIKMLAAAPGAPLVVGCSAVSAQQIYVADAVRRTGRRGIVVVPRRKVRTAATEWAAAQGAEIVEAAPGYRSVCMARARAISLSLGACVRWDRHGAVLDTAEQVSNLPAAAERIVVPTGSGLVAAGVLVGLALARRRTPVIACAVSPLAEEAEILMLARDLLGKAGAVWLPRFTFARLPSRYERPIAARLPDGTPLDPYYAAKVLHYVHEGDLLWVTGRRPVAAMPREVVQDERV